jgi:hypothetical protein
MCSLLGAGAIFVARFRPYVLHFGMAEFSPEPDQ